MQSESGPSLQKKRPTQQDVARLAGVSQATVSYVLNNRATVSVPPETRARVLAAMQELGYVPNVTARSLRTSKSYTIASIIPDITNPFYPALERGIQDIAHENDYHLLIYNTDGIAARERGCLDAVQQARVDGIVAVLFHLSAKDLFPLLENGVAIVRIESAPKAAGPYPLDNLYVDNAKAARSAVEYLLGRGYSRIGMITGRGGPGRTREDGYRDALAADGRVDVDGVITTAGFTERDGYEGMLTVLAREPWPDAVFASNDLLAMGALLAIRERGLRVPEDIALMGFDDIPMARLVSPPLTTISQFQRQLGRRAAEMLFERLNGDLAAAGRTEEMPFQLIERASA
ncbi:MAG: LacI family DNA-binding transcriptional regulator [Caldilineaceae bacterium]|nr:LacI family DNA-binding transcriptional regulator [Caldilineaceae bacterium]MCB9162397.1 LacI family DNA-binding transcriptional regulator [Caldilineaceae bacterium]